MSDAELYIEREQTLVKHFILRKYLERFAPIVGSFAESITYIDCFSGPWNVRSQVLKDSSFAIALEELRKARKTLAGRGKTLGVRCFFLEKDRAAYSKLKDFADSVTDAHLETRNTDLEGAIGDILKFVRQGGRDSFPFVFIDPTGWSGFGMSRIAPLLQLTPGEVLINFMTGHIRRFIDSPNEQTQESFAELFGSGDYRQKVQGLEKQDREDALVEAYVENVRKQGGFPYVCTAIILHPEINRTHFHLLYATRNLKGVEVFKETEKRAMAVMEGARADAQKRKREKETRAKDLFESEVLYDPTHYETLRERYLSQAKNEVQQWLASKRAAKYDEVWQLALVKRSLVWESDLKEWIAGWEKAGLVKVEGMGERQRVPQRGKNNTLLWMSPSVSGP